MKDDSKRRRLLMYPTVTCSRELLLSDEIVRKNPSVTSGDRTRYYRYDEPVAKPLHHTGLLVTSVNESICRLCLLIYEAIYESKRDLDLVLTTEFGFKSQLRQSFY